MILQLIAILYCENKYPCVDYPASTVNDVMKGSILVFLTGVSLGMFF